MRDVSYLYIAWFSQLTLQLEVIHNYALRRYVPMALLVWVFEYSCHD